MTDHHLDDDDVLKDLDAALRVEPSRAFAEGVRARVTRSHIATRNMWWGLAAAASVGLATMAVWRPAVEVPATLQVASHPAAVTAEPTSVPVPTATPERTVVRAVAAPMLQQATPIVSVTADATSEPRLEVITNQGAVLRALWDDYRGRPMVIAEVAPAVDGLAPKLITVGEIVVAPIVVVEMGTEPVPAGGTPIIRRANATKETR
jgi:hypothetical protein